MEVRSGRKSPAVSSRSPIWTGDLGKQATLLWFPKLDKGLVGDLKKSPAPFPKLNCQIRMKIPILKISFEESVFSVEAFEEGSNFSFDSPLKVRLCSMAVPLQTYTPFF